MVSSSIKNEHGVRIQIMSKHNTVTGNSIALDKETSQAIKLGPKKVSLPMISFVTSIFSAIVDYLRKMLKAFLEKLSEQEHSEHIPYYGSWDMYGYWFYTTYHDELRHEEEKHFHED